MGPIAIGVLILLLIASLYSWTVILGKMASFRKATKESKRFIRAFRKATRLQDIAGVASECTASPLAQVFEDVYEAYKRQTGGTGPLRSLTPIERAAFVLRHLEDRGSEEIGAALGIAPNAAKQAVFRAVQKLRVRLAALRVSA